MSFISWQYFIFLPVVLVLYWLLPVRRRLLLLLAGSYFFYACWDVRFLALVLATTVIDYNCGLSIARRRKSPWLILGMALLPAAWLLGCFLCLPASHLSPSLLAISAVAGLAFFGAHEAIGLLAEDRRPKYYLILSVVFCLTILGFFKYFNFFTDSFKSLMGVIGFEPDFPLLKIILPVGISFYTFQSLGYVIDVYRGQSPACGDFLTFATFDAFFPQMVSGPIERGKNLIPQLEKGADFRNSHIQDGLRLMLVGFFKKIFVADNCAILANYAFDPQTSLNGYWAVMGVVAFAFQIYADFSGYTDIARGSAKLLGIDLMENFRFPYFSRTPSEFWSRWHISLSTWFRDYLYIPLGGNRGARWETLRNLGIVMLLAGLWHGANWVFVLWGAYHGGLLILYRVVPPFDHIQGQGEAWTWQGIAAVPLMFVLTLVGWAIFRSPSVTFLGTWFGALGNWNPATGLAWESSSFWLLIHILPLILLQVLTWKYRDEASLSQVPWLARGLVYALMILLIVSSGEQDKEFIYFQF
ncbi:MAG: MBOAT family O-acyltransferase [Thermodesulfobacteriota bacterium]